MYAEVVDGENVGAAKAEDQKHFNGPGADAADGDEALDEFFVGHFFGLLECGDDAVDGLLREVFHGEDFCAGEASFAEGRLFELEHFLWSGDAAGGAEGFDTAEDGGGGFAGDGLIGDGFKEGVVGGFVEDFVELEWGGRLDESGEFFVAGGEVGAGGGEVKGERSGHGGKQIRIRTKRKEG